MRDHIERFGASLLQHGPHNDRVYLMHLEAEDLPAIIERMEELAGTASYGKIFAKVPLPLIQDFVNKGYRKEALIPCRNASNEEGLVFVSRFLRDERACPADRDQLSACLDAATKRAGRSSSPRLPSGYILEPCGPGEAQGIAELYARIFRTYPFPIDDASYLREAMQGDTVYYGVFCKGELVAASAAEKDSGLGHVEMTDFAVLPEQRGLGLSHLLLLRMEQDMAGTKTDLAYTICRATGVGMNVTFARSGYLFAGTLVNNTQIGGGFESMNVWYRYLPVPRT
jgi:beta-lysine N6-acetyltransferase